MTDHKPPSAEEQLSFIKRVQRLFDEGDFSATYKYALIIALTELAVEKGDDSGSPLSLDMRAIAEKFAELYWPQTVPYVLKANDSNDSNADLLFQNLGKQAAVINSLLVVRNSGANTFSQAQLSSDWKKSISSITKTVKDMPVKYLQNFGGISDYFLYDLPVSNGQLVLKAGVAYNLRRFQSFLQQFARMGWIEHVRSNARNIPIVGVAGDLETFMFHSDRRILSKVGEFLKDLQDNQCFYCRRDLKKESDVDHFIPWSQYPRDTGHNFVLAHPSCNRKKRDALAAKQHLEKWLSRNEVFDGDLSQELNTLGFISDRATSQAVARWAYQQGVEIGARAWVNKDSFEVVNQDYLRLLSQ